MKVAEEAPRDGRIPIECRDCGAYLQWVRFQGQDLLRCPWVKDWNWGAASMEHGIVTRIYCDWPMGAKRVIGGIRTDSVA